MVVAKHPGEATARALRDRLAVQLRQPVDEGRPAARGAGVSRRRIARTSSASRRRKSPDMSTILAPVASNSGAFCGADLVRQARAARRHSPPRPPPAAGPRTAARCAPSATGAPRPAAVPRSRRSPPAPARPRDAMSSRRISSAPPYPLPPMTAAFNRFIRLTKSSAGMSAAAPVDNARAEDLVRSGLTSRCGSLRFRTCKRSGRIGLLLFSGWRPGGGRSRWRAPAPPPRRLRSRHRPASPAARIAARPLPAPPPKMHAALARVTPGMVGEAWTVFRGDQARALQDAGRLRPQELHAQAGHHPGARRRSARRVLGHRRRHERQPGLHQRQAGGRHRLRLVVLQGAARRRDADRGDARRAPAPPPRQATTCWPRRGPTGLPHVAVAHRRPRRAAPADGLGAAVDLGRLARRRWMVWPRTSSPSAWSRCAWAAAAAQEGPARRPSTSSSLALPSASSWSAAT